MRKDRDIKKPAPVSWLAPANGDPRVQLGSKFRNCLRELALISSRNANSRLTSVARKLTQAHSLCEDVAALPC